MYIEIKIINPKNLEQRAYVEYYFLNKRYREYNGKRLSLEINPNRVKTAKQREASLKKLQFEFLKAFENDWYPNKPKDSPTLILTLYDALRQVIEEKLSNNYSLSYKTDLQSIYNKFLEQIPSHLLQNSVKDFDKIDYDKFLVQFKTSSTHYMNRRRTLGVLFSELVRKRLIAYNPLRETIKLKGLAKLHQIYSSEQLNTVLAFLKVNYPNLHLCCLIAYGCFLRPHQEIRLLKLKHINDVYTQIRLSGSENKSKRVRVVNIPIYVQEELKFRLQNIKNPEINIISNELEAYNICYFNLQWSRAKKKMEKIGLIEKNQTIYSFRHTAAVNVYRKTKDLNILQQLLGHSDMLVTLKYLRGLGEATNEDLKNVMPEL